VGFYDSIAIGREERRRTEVDMRRDLRIYPKI
jgi:hypothetical protein